MTVVCAVCRASVTTFTRGGHGYADEEGLSSMASPQRPGYDEGANFHQMDSAQQPELSGPHGEMMMSSPEGLYYSCAKSHDTITVYCY